MLRQVKELNGYRLGARDGEIGYARLSQAHKKLLRRLRQNGIHEELFGFVSGFEALTPKGSR
jgi:hypothetical protein